MGGRVHDKRGDPPSIWVARGTRLLLTDKCEQPPVLGYPLESVVTAISERNAGPGYKVLDRGRDDDFARPGAGRHPLGHVDGNATNVFSPHLDLAGVEAHPHLDTQSLEAVSNRAPA